VLTLENGWLELGVDETDGCIHRLRLSSPSNVHEYVEKTSLAARFAQCRWGQWELRDAFTTHKPADATLRVTGADDSITARWETEGYVISITRQLGASRMIETVSLEARQTLAITDFSVAFRPAVTDFLDASNVSVGEHTSFIQGDEPRSSFHWFTGGDYAHLMFTQVTGRGPHLGVVLTEGRIHALTTPYLHGGPTLVNDYQAFSASQMYPRLHVTSFATHQQGDEYPQPILDMRAGDVETFRLAYFPFEELDEFSNNVRGLGGQPTFTYPRFWPVGQELEIVVDLPDPRLALVASFDAAAVPSARLSETRHRLTIRPNRSGLQRVEIGYGTRKTFLLFEAVHDVGELLSKRVEYILSTQQCLDRADRRYGGIFMTDMRTGELVTRDDLYTVQVAGTGEMVATGQLVLYQNLIDPDPGQIRQAEIYANEWLRLRCQDEDFSTPLNPLNRMNYKDRGWHYASGRAKLFNNPDFPVEKAWRVHNANWIAPFYFLLSEVPDRSLTMGTSSTYLDWAFRTMKWQFETEPRMSADQSYFVPRVVAKLRRVGRDGDAALLRDLWLAFVGRIVGAAGSLAAGNFNFDDSMFYCSAIPLLIESKVDEARQFLESQPYNVGISYDPRVQTAFRYWDDYLTDLPYLMMPYLTRPHFWSIANSYPLLQLYEATHDEAILDRAYQGILAFYEHYNFGYRWNKWGEMQLGQGHPCFLPSHDLHTQEGVCADQDPAFVTYLETFGSRCYVTPTGRAVNGAFSQDRLESWAPFSREFHLDDRGLLVSCDSYSVAMPWIEVGDRRIGVLARNLSRNPVTTRICLSGSAQQAVSVSLGPGEEQRIEIELGR
jgi:hypothetical protein